MAKCEFFEKSLFARIISELSSLRVKLQFLLGRPLIYGINTAVWRDAFFRVGGFPEVPSEDIEFSKRIRKVGKVIYVESISVETSLRRFLKEGAAKTILYYAGRDFVSLFSGKISPPKFLEYREVR